MRSKEILSLVVYLIIALTMCGLVEAITGYELGLGRTSPKGFETEDGAYLVQLIDIYRNPPSCKISFLVSGSGKEIVSIDEGKSEKVGDFFIKVKKIIDDPVLDWRDLCYVFVFQKAYCTESDGGADYYTQGETISGGLKYKDACVELKMNATRLEEYFCDEYGGLNSALYKCPFGCSHGQCIPEKLSIIPYKEFDLLYYPAFFVDNGKFEVYVVVGENAPTTDVIAATEIVSSIDYKGLSENTPKSMLDTEVINDLADINVISVGSPCNNKVTAKIMGLNGSCENVFVKDDGIIILYKRNGYYQLVVSGRYTNDIQRAAKVLSEYHTNHFQGRIITVRGTMEEPKIYYGGRMMVGSKEKLIEFGPESPETETEPENETKLELETEQILKNGTILEPEVNTSEEINETKGDEKNLTQNQSQYDYIESDYKISASESLINKIIKFLFGWL